jgi:lysozyme family protein
VTIDDVLTDVLRREGWPTVSDHPWDRGGLTRGGITFRSLNGWREKHGERHLTEDEFRVLSEDEARAFLLDEFFGPLRFIRHDPTFVLLADWAVTSGVDDPVKALQYELKERGLYGAAIDGIPGPMTRLSWSMVTAKSHEVEDVRKALVRARIRFYVDLALDKPARIFMQANETTQMRNLRGWVNRAVEFV